MLFSIHFFFPKKDKDCYTQVGGAEIDAWGMKFLKGTKAAEVGLDEAQPHVHLILKESSLLDVSEVPHSSMKHFAFADPQQCPSLTGMISQHGVELRSTGILRKHASSSDPAQDAAAVAALF